LLKLRDNTVDSRFAGSPSPQLLKVAELEANLIIEFIMFLLADLVVAILGCALAERG
jgi:hypothetical protein